MLRAILSVIAGVVTWMVIATIGNLVLRLAWPGYALSEPTMAFTPPMLLARLVLGAAASIGAGYVGAWISHGSRAAAGVLAAILPIFFLPVHYRLWDTFPPWYHATFLISLVVLTLAGAMIRGLAGNDAEPSTADRTAGP